MCCGTWLNRGTVLGLCVGLMLATGAAVGWYHSRPAPNPNDTVRETPNPSPAPPPSPAPAAPAPITKAERAEQIRKLEKLADSLRVEIEAIEKQIELTARATGAADKAQLASLQNRHASADEEYIRVDREITKLEAEVTVLKRQLDDKNPKPMPDPILLEQTIAKNPRVVAAKTALDEKKSELAKTQALFSKPDSPPIVALTSEVAKLEKSYDETRKAVAVEAIQLLQVAENASKRARLVELSNTIAIKKEERENAKAERDTLQKLIAAGTEGGDTIESMRKAIEPQRETLGKVQSLLAELRIQQQLAP